MATSSPALTTGFSQLLTKDFEEVMFNLYNKRAEEYSIFAKMSTEGSLHQIKKGEVTGLGPMQEVNEGGAVPYESPDQGNSKEIEFSKFALGFQITEEMQDDDLTGIMRQMPAQLGNAAFLTKELQWWDLLNSGFVTTNRSGLDSLALFSASHTRPDASGTDSNLGSGALTETTLRAAILAYKNMKDQKGYPMIMMPKVLLIPPELEWKAKELLLSPLQADTADNNVNVFDGEGVRYHVAHWFTSTTAWFLLADEHDLQFIWRKPLAMQNSDDFNTGNALFKGTMRFAVDFWNYRGAYGSTGA